MQYQKLFELKISNRYFQTAENYLFSCYPLLNSQQLLSNHQLIFKNTGQGFFLIFPYEHIDQRLKVLFAKETVLRFIVYNNDECLLNYSNLPFAIPDRAEKFFYLENMTGNSPLVNDGQSLTEKELISLKRFMTKTARKDNQTTMPYFSQSEEDAILRKIPFAIVDISVNPGLPEQCRIINQEKIEEEIIQTSTSKTFTLNIDSRSVFWRYKVLVLDTVPDKYTIQWESCKFIPSQPQELSSGKKQFIFTSSTTLELKKDPRKNVALLEKDSGKIIIANLPNPATSSVYFDNNDKKYYAEAVIDLT